jgi:hypothetical protein
VPQAGLSHLRGPGSRSSTLPSSSSDSLPRRPEASRSDSGRSDSGSMTPPSHSRQESSSSIASSTGGRTTPTPANAGVAGKKPSPLSQRAQPTADDDDDDSAAVYGGSDDGNDGRATPVQPAAAAPAKKGGLGKLRKALSFSTLSEIQAAEAAAAAPERQQGGRVIGRKSDAVSSQPPAFSNSSADTNGSTGSTRSTSPPRTPDNGAPIMPASSAASISSRRSGRPPLSGSAEGGGGKRSLFNRKFNSSTDNISISSTVSSASVMLRKVGNLGKLARRHSLMGLTNMFNKDKDGGRDGMQGDAFGTIPERGPGAADDSTLAASSSSSTLFGKKDKKADKASKTKKGAPALASVSHATVELESSDMMTPAASYVRQHQLQMKAEAEARAERERVAAAAAAAAEAEARARASKTKTTDDVMETRQKMVEREKERLKSKRGWRKKLGVGSSTSSAAADAAAAAPTGLETMPSSSYTQVSPAGPTPLEEPQHAPYAGYAGAAAGSANGYDEQTYDGAGYDDDEEPLAPPRLPGSRGGEESGDEFETDSLRHWGEGIEQARASAANIKSVRGILKNTGQERPSGPAGVGAFEKPFAGRLRANSYDAPPVAAAGGVTPGVPLMSQMSETPAGTDRMDGVAPLRPDSPASGERTPTVESPIGSARNLPSGAPMGHHSNSSMPTLSLMMKPGSSNSVPQRSVTAPQKKRIIFAEQQIFHSTWPAHVYDRRGELATCNRLTPLLAQRIKEELNTYKMEEMAVAPTSRINTHFFV